eukprot:gene8808-10442_t
MESDAEISRQKLLIFGGYIYPLCGGNLDEATVRDLSRRKWCHNVTNDRALVFDALFEPPLVYVGENWTRIRQVDPLCTKKCTIRKELRKDLPASITADRIEYNGGMLPDYTTSTVTSIFCLAAEGKLGGFGVRITHAVLAGCIPVLVKPVEGQSLIFDDILPYHRFAVVVYENETETLPARLAAYSPEEIRSMRAELACALPRFYWSSIHGSYLGENFRADAFATMMLLLRRRLDGGATPQVAACRNKKAPLQISE